MRVLGDITRLNARRYPGKTAVVAGEARLGYADLETRANRLAHGLLALGVQAGDRVALMALNCLDYPVVAAAAAKCGAVLVPVNFRYARDELVYVVNHAEPRVLLAGPEVAPVVEAARARFRPEPRLVSLGEPPPRDGATLDSLTAGAPGHPPGIHVDPAAAAMLMYTSGTTGVPKGVLYSHAAYLSVYQGLAIEGDLGHDDVVLVGLPLFHNGGLNALLQPSLMLGATVVVMGRGFDPEAALAAVARHRVTLTLWVPTMLAMLVQHPAGGHDLSSLTKIWYGSSPISPPVLEAARARFRARFYQFYGQTETGMNAVLRPEDHAERSQCTGREMVNAEVRVVDDDGREVSPGGVGEIVSAQRALGMIGYFKDEAATREAIRDGWIHTGDLARVENGGYFTVVDRKRDMIISGAENIYPKEIEDVLAAHPDVSEAAVFGIPDEVYGEAVCAAVVPRPGTRVTAEEIVEFCAVRLARYKRPRRVDLLQALPRNAAGKVTKHVLREPFWQGRARRV